MAKNIVKRLIIRKVTVIINNKIVLYTNKKKFQKQQKNLSYAKRHNTCTFSLLEKNNK